MCNATRKAKPPICNRGRRQPRNRLPPNLPSNLKAQLLKTPTGNTKRKKATGNSTPGTGKRKTLAGQTVNNIVLFMRSAINRAIATGAWSGVNPLSTKGGTWKMVKSNNDCVS